MRRRAFIGSAVASATALAIPRHDAFAAALPRLWRGQELEAITGDGQTVTLSARAITELRDSLRGKLLLASSEGYDQARRVLNPSFDKRPALIVQPTGVADIRTAINFARDNRGLLLAVKCGGHSYSGQSTNDRGMLIDLSLFRDVRVDPSARRAWVTGGSLLGQVDHEAMAFGLVTPLGTVSHTGVGGLVTGGGFGRLARRFGLAIDNLISIDVVSADGQLRHASASENQDLFWGVRGGGGNFGIVTNFEFQLHPMQRQVLSGFIAYPIDKARDAFAVFGEYGAAAPDTLAFGIAMSKPPGDRPGIVGFDVCFSGAERDAERALAPLRRIGTPLNDTVRAMDYVAVQRAGDVTDARAQITYLKSGFIPSMPAGLIDAIVQGFRADPRRGTAIFFQTGGGAIARVPANATAFSQRDIHSNMLLTASWPNGQNGTDHIAYIREYWQTLERFTHGFYVNDLDPEASRSSVSANYRANHDRLVTVKNKYDPRNLFRMNANVVPTVSQTP
jgi:FAD/FMN-containing dehydrogenase